MVQGCPQAIEGSNFNAAVFHQIPNFPNNVWKIDAAFLVAFQQCVETRSTKRKQNKSLGKHLRYGKAKNEKVNW